MPIRRALFWGCETMPIEPFAEMLAQCGVEVGADPVCLARLRARGVPAVDVADWADRPTAPAESIALDGRIHAALGADPSAAVVPIDLLFVQLLPAPVGAPGALDGVRAQMDLARVALLRTAARYGAAIMIDEDDIPDVGNEFFKSTDLDLSRPTRDRLAVKALGALARYETELGAAAGYAAADEPLFPKTKALSLDRVGMLHAQDERGAALYAPRVTLKGTFGEALLYGTGPDALPTARVVRDADAAVVLAGSFDEPTFVLWARGRPVMVAVAPTIPLAFAAIAPQLIRPLSAATFASNVEIPKSLGAPLRAVPIATVIAPSFDPEALDELKQRASLAIIALRDRPPIGEAVDITSLNGAILLSKSDVPVVGEVSRGRVLSQRQPTPAELRGLEVAWMIAARAPSDAVVLCRVDDQGTVRTVGIGAGAVSRRRALEMALAEAGAAAAGAVLASDGSFVDKADVDLLARQGVIAVAHPGTDGDAALLSGGSHVLAWIATDRSHVS